VTPSCRICSAPLRHTFVDLGETPLANAFLSSEDLCRQEARFPLHAYVCDRCFLVQVEAVASPQDMFAQYVYFSSFSETWLEHARRYCDMATRRFCLNEHSRVVEIASNDGYLLKNFVQAGIPCLGVEPASNVAEAAIANGVPTETRFFGTAAATDLVARGWQSDLVVANNVVAHVPALRDFLLGLSRLVKPSGTITIEVPHVLRLIADTQFDTIYHEHLCYFSLNSLEFALQSAGLYVFDVEELSTHGGSLRLYVAHKAQTESQSTDAAIQRVRAKERTAKLHTLDGYQNFRERVGTIIKNFQSFLAQARTAGRSVVGYGAAAKGNTLLNVAGVGADAIPFVVDRSPAKQGLYLPGSRIPVRSPDAVWHERPDFLLILPWNLADEIAEQMAGIRAWGGQFVTVLPTLRIW
jgi:SAM-dependent methyltransferase